MKFYFQIIIGGVQRVAQQHSRTEDLRAVFRNSKFNQNPGEIVYDLLGEGILGSAKWVGLHVRNP